MSTIPKKLSTPVNSSIFASRLLLYFRITMNNDTDCEIIRWSQQAAKIVEPIFYMCIIAAINHLLFWIQFIAYPSVRQRSMQWLYAYLGSDLLLLIRFFVFYIYRWSSICVPHSLRLIICYCEAIFDNYLNLLQSYILLALNVCRYIQIVYNHNVYSSNGYAIIIAHLLISTLPLLGHLVTIMFGWSKLESPPGDTCDLIPKAITVRLLFLLFSYFIPVVLALVFLSLCLHHIRNTKDIRTKEIVNARLKYHRQLVIQSVVFYSLWLIFWSPHLLIFPFYYTHSTIGLIAQIMNCISIAIDPLVITTLDVRFLKAWRSTSIRLKGRKRQQRPLRIPVILYTGPSQEAVNHISDEI